MLADDSIGGLFIRGSELPPIGTQVTLCMQDPGHQEAQVQASVVWQRPGAGYGAKFTDQPDRISRFVQTLQRASASWPESRS